MIAVARGLLRGWRAPARAATPKCAAALVVAVARSPGGRSRACQVACRSDLGVRSPRMVISSMLVEGHAYRASYRFRR